MADGDDVYSRLTRRLGTLSTGYRIEGGIFVGLESVLLLFALFHVTRECRNRSQFAALYVFIHRMLVCGTSLHIIELAVTLHSTYGNITGYVGTIASNIKQLPSIACLFYFIGVTFEVYQIEFLPGRASTIANAWRVLVIMLLGFMVAIVVSLILMFNKELRWYNVITTIWEGACFAVTLVVVLFATCRLKQAAKQRRASIGRRASGAVAADPLTPLLRKVGVISIILVGCFLASLMGAYSVFVNNTTFGGTDKPINLTPPPSYVYWDWILLDIMYITIHSVITVLSWKSPRPRRAMEDSAQKSIAWDRKSSGSSKPRMPLSPLSLNSQHSQDDASRYNEPSNHEEHSSPSSPPYSREHSNSDYALSG